MTQAHEAGAALPLSVTCSPDDRFADAVRALVGRVGTLAGDPVHALPFTAAVEQVVAWVLAHPDTVTGEVAMLFDRDGDRLRGHFRWATTGNGSAVPAPAVASSPDVQVACDREGPEVSCRVSCRCA